MEENLKYIANIMAWSRVVVSLKFSIDNSLPNYRNNEDGEKNHILENDNEEKKPNRRKMSKRKMNKQQQRRQYEGDIKMRIFFISSKSSGRRNTRRKRKRKKSNRLLTRSTYAQHIYIRIANLSIRYARYTMSNWC